jgi:hypothetical protein
MMLLKKSANVVPKMSKERDTLRKIEALPAPRHLFILPDWAEPATLERLIQDGYLDCGHSQRDEKGSLNLAMELQLTAKAERLIHPRHDWRRLAMRGSLAGASFGLMSVVILYLG